MEPLSITQVNEYLKRLFEWGLEDNGKAIAKIFEFKDFTGAMEFVNEVAVIAEQEKHHPEMLIYENKVEIKLTTNSAQALTEKDFKVAEEIDSINANN
ncbi:MAG: 4a-hydroxytetrahydrobiopterin dehydratase [Nanoarchaeota archaeon]